MGIVRVEVDMNAPVELTSEQLEELREAALRPIVYDEECPPQTKEELKQFRRVNAYNKAKMSPASKVGV